MQNSKMAVLGGLRNSFEEKGSAKQRRKAKIYPLESGVPELARRDE